MTTDDFQPSTLKASVSSTDCVTGDGKFPDVINDPRDRERRHGANLFLFARSCGWKDDGEGPLEFVLRQAYKQGAEDEKGEV